MGAGSLRDYLLMSAILLCGVRIVPASAAAPMCNTIQGNCACDTDQGTIDLSPLDSKDPNNPKFKDVADSSGGTDMFSYNPCSAFSEGNSCSNVAVCQAVDSFGGTYPIGDQSSVAWINVDVNGQSVLQLQYTSMSSFDGITRTSTITLTCDQGQEGSLIANGETYPGAALYTFELKSRHACPPIAQHGCRKTVGNCTCVTDEGGVIDLSPLDSKHPYIPRFHNILDTSGGSSVFSYNPCSPFTQGGGCSNVATCLIFEKFGAYYYYPIGTQTSVTWLSRIVNGTSVMELHYSAYSIFDKLNRTSVITLTCDREEEGVLTPYGESFPDSTRYEFELRSRHACFRGNPQTPKCNTVQGNCACVTDQGLIDLSPLDSKNSSQPRFHDILDQTTGYKYSYNPCTPFSQGSDCSGVSGCQLVDDDGTTYPIGDQDSITWVNEAVEGSTVLQLQYKSISNFDGLVRTSAIMLTCDVTEEGRLIFKGETHPESAYYVFELRSTHACPRPDPAE